MIDNKENTNVKPEQKVDTKVSPTNSLMDLLIIDKEQLEAEQEFLKHDVVSLVSGYRFTRHDRTNELIKVQIQSVGIDEETGDEIEFKYTLNADEDNAIVEKDIEALKGKYISVTGLKRYTTVHRDNKDRELGRDHRFGGDIKDMTTVKGDDINIFDLKAYVEITLTSVANVLKKGNPTGDVKLISQKTESNGNIKSFSCKLKHTDMKLDKAMFANLLNKKIRINYIKDSRFNGQTNYTAEFSNDVIELV